MTKINHYLSFIFTNLILLLSIYSLEAQQWNGSTTTGNTIYRWGRVGIGEPNPQFRLDIQGNINPAIRIRSNNIGVQTFLSVISSNGTYSNVSQTGDVALMADGSTGNFIIGSRTNNSILFTTGTASTETTRMSLLSDGKVKIGNAITSSGYKLFVEEGIKTEGLLVQNGFNPAMEVRSNSGARAYFSVVDANANYSNVAQVGDVVLTTGGSSSGNLIVASRSNKSILFTTGTSGFAWTPGAETTRMAILNDGKVKIGDVTTPGEYKLYVEEGILTEKIKVALHDDPNNWADYVFNADYKLMPLHQLKKYVEKHNHLPNIPSTQELIDNGGVELMEMTKLQMEKIEELTLYMIQMNEKLEELETENKALKKRLEAMEE